MQCVPGVGGLAALDELVLLLLVHLLELEVARVGGGSELAALENHKHHGANDGDEVERQVHEVADDGAGSEFGKGLCGELAQLRDGVAAGLDGALLRNQRGLVARHERAVEGVDQGIVNEEVLAQHVEDGRALAEHQQHRGYEGERAIEDGEDGGLRHVGHDEHEYCDAEAQRHGRDQLLRERPP